MLQKFYFFLVLLLVMGCAACSPLEEILANSPKILESVEASFVQTDITRVADVAETIEASKTPPLEVADTFVPAPPSAQQPDGGICLRAAPGIPLDVTIPDGTYLTPGESFSKTWRLINHGSCAWTSDYLVVWFSGIRFGAPYTQTFHKEVQPGESVEITLDLIAPVQAGAYQGNWKLMAPDGQMFGIGPGGNAPFWVRIEVIELATATSAPIPSSTPTPIAYSQGTMKLSLGSKVNLDNGDLNLAGNNDFELINSEQGELTFSIFNSARLAYFGTRVPSLVECLRMEQIETRITLSQEYEGNYYCYRTNQGLPGYIRLDGVNVIEGRANISYVTWFVP